VATSLNNPRIILFVQVATSLNNLAGLLVTQGKHEDAWDHYHRALVIRRVALGEHHPDVAQLTNNIAGLLRKQGRVPEARVLYERSLATLQVRREKDCSLVTALGSWGKHREGDTKGWSTYGASHRAGQLRNICVL
jgi:tetratricopeptide (TPR) repeat protein